MSIEVWTFYAAVATLDIAVLAAIISAIAIWQSKQTGKIIEQQKDILKHSLILSFTKEMVSTLDIKDSEERFTAFTEIYMMVGYMFEKMEEGPMELEIRNGIPQYKFDINDYQRWLREQIKEETGEEPVGKVGD